MFSTIFWQNKVSKNNVNHQTNNNNYEYGYQNPSTATTTTTNNFEYQYNNNNNNSNGSSIIDSTSTLMECNYDFYQLASKNSPDFNTNKKKKTFKNNIFIDQPLTSKQQDVNFDVNSLKAFMKQRRFSIRQRQVANQRERDRTHSVNSAFVLLRSMIPTDPIDRKLSKIETLRLAGSYISHLSMILNSPIEYANDKPCINKFKYVLSLIFFQFLFIFPFFFCAVDIQIINQN
jgi:hypothetical protein